MAFSGVTLINGRKIEEGAAVSLDQGLNFGRGVFETIDVVGNVPVFVDAHLERLHRGLAALSIDKALCKEQILEYMRVYNIHDCAMKILVTPENVIISTRENPYRSGGAKQGFKVCLSLLKRNPHSHVVYHKTINYTDNILEKEAAAKAGFDEVIFANVYGYLAEGSTTNIFFVRNNRVYTPSVGCGILDGIVRNWVIANFKVEEGEYTLNQLAEADEIFLTNSLMGIMPVREFQNRVFGNKGKISNEIQKTYCNELGKIGSLKKI